MKRVNKMLVGEEKPQPSGSSGDGGRKMSTCSSGSEVLAEGFDEGGEQFVETMREHQDINLDIVNNSEVPECNADGVPGNIPCVLFPYIYCFKQQSNINSNTVAAQYYRFHLFYSFHINIFLKMIN